MKLPEVSRMSIGLTLIPISLDSLPILSEKSMLLPKALLKPNSQRTEFPKFQQLSKNQLPKETAQLK